MTTVLAQGRRVAVFPATQEMFSAPIPQEHFLDPNSYWRRPVTDHTPYQHPTIPEANSANWVRSLCQQMFIDPNTGAWVGGDNTAYCTVWAGIPFYVIPAGYPRRPFRVASYNLTTVGGTELDAQLQLGVPAPLDLATGAGADHSAILYQPSTDTMWEIFSLQKSNPANSYYDIAGWGGVVYGVSKFSGTFRDVFRSDDVQVQHSHWGASATSISLAGGIPDPFEAIDGEIEHALPMTVGHAQGSPLQWVPPAVRGDGVEYGRPDYIPEGARIVIPESADWSRAYALGEGWKKFCRAMQRFGIIPMDKTGGGVALKIREGVTDAWLQVLTLYNTDVLAGWRMMSSVPWNEAIIVNP